MPTLPPIPVICGPTAGGKSALAVEVALGWKGGTGGGEIVTADAFQVYRGMDIGTAKPTAAERRGVPHHLIDVAEPGQDKFTVDQWLKAAEKTIGEIQQRGKLPIVVGGTHLYVKMLVEGMFEGPAANEALRAELNALEPALRRAELERVDPAAAQKIHPNDVRRTVRALEVFRLTGTPISTHQTQWDTGGEGKASPYQLVILDWPTEAINKRINARVKQMIEQGLVDESRALWAAGKLEGSAGEALGYKQLVEYFDGRVKKIDDAVEKIKIETRRFAKNQRTWLRRLSMTGGGGALRLAMSELSIEKAARRVLKGSAH